MLIGGGGISRGNFPIMPGARLFGRKIAGNASFSCRCKALLEKIHNGTP